VLQPNLKTRMSFSLKVASVSACPRGPGHLYVRPAVCDVEVLCSHRLERP